VASGPSCDFAYTASSNLVCPSILKTSPIFNNFEFVLGEFVETFGEDNKIR